MKATEEELKMIAEFDASEGVDKGTNGYMNDDEIIDFAKQYHTKQLILHGVSNRRELLNGFRKFTNENIKEGYIMPYLIDEYLENI